MTVIQNSFLKLYKKKKKSKNLRNNDLQLCYVFMNKENM